MHGMKEIIQEAEFNEAIEYYEGCELGLGYDFSVEVLAVIQNIIN